MKPGETRQETAFTTFGLKAPALDFLFEQLEGYERKRFFKTLKSCQTQFQYAQTQLALKLLHQYFNAQILADAPFATYQRNAISTLFKVEKRALIDEAQYEYD